MKRTKIVATLGPSSASPEAIAALAEAGMDVARVNASHGTPAEHESWALRVREVSRALGRPLGLMLDTRGPEVRVGELPEPLELGEGELVLLGRRGILVTHQGLPEDVPVGARVLLDDGRISLRVEGKEEGALKCRVERGGRLRPGKRVSVPGVRLDLPPLSPADRESLKLARELSFEFVALSFVQRPEDVIAARRELGDGPWVIAKVETAAAVDRMAEVVAAADGVMVARGDLGVEMPPWEVPLIQKRIIEACNRAGKPVIVATQMLESMVSNPLPTRAEASDVANALLDGADAVMLSAETAVGQYPVEAVRVMNNIGQVVEQRISRVEWGEPRGMPLPDVIGSLAARAVEAVEPSVILVATRSGFSALMVSKHRPRASILAFAPHIRILRRMHLYWGVKPVEVDWSDDRDTLLLRAVRRSLELGYISRGDIVEIVSGSTLTPPGQTTTLEILRVDDILDQAGA